MTELDGRMLGTRIKEARERSGLSQAELAERAGLDRTAVSKVESGIRKVSALELLDIASGLGLRMSSLLRESTPALVAHRMQQDRDALSTSVDVLIERLVVDVEFLAELAGDTMGLTESAQTLLGADLRSPTSVRDAEDLAQTARAILHLDDREPVYDLLNLVGDVGLMAFSMDAGVGAADAGTVLLRTGGVSLVNSHNKIGRRRLALAHELGHYLAQDQYSLDWRVGDPASRDIEARLDRFARCFLLPEEGLREEWHRQDGRELRDVAVILGSHFRVDMSTLARRARELDLADAGEADLIRQVSTTRADFVEFGLVMEPQVEGTVLPLKFQRAVLHLVRDERISRERAIDLLRGSFTEDELPPVRIRRDDEIWNSVS